MFTIEKINDCYHKVLKNGALFAKVHYMKHVSGKYEVDGVMVRQCFHADDLDEVLRRCESLDKVPALKC